MPVLENSMRKLEKVIGNKLGSISDRMSVEELSKINIFMDEAKKLHNSMSSIANGGEGLETEVELSEDDYRDFLFNALVDASHMIVDLYRLLDDNRMKELDMEWIIEDIQAFLEHVRNHIGYRIPELPPFRMVTKPTEKEEKSGKVRPKRNRRNKEV